MYMIHVYDYIMLSILYHSQMKGLDSTNMHWYKYNFKES